MLCKQSVTCLSLCFRNKLAYRLPDMDGSDNENLDCESTVSTESPLEDKITHLGLEGQ